MEKTTPPSSEFDNQFITAEILEGFGFETTPGEERPVYLRNDIQLFVTSPSDPQWVVYQLMPEQLDQSGARHLAHVSLVHELLSLCERETGERLTYAGNAQR